MNDWTRGYVSDLEYLPGFYGDQAPEHLDLVCLLNGALPPRRGERFTYCELGSGQGLTALALAAANPEGEFYAVDFNPAHIARARDMAAEAGLGNVTCLEESFETLADGGPELPEFDYITLHGVWSWVSPDLREAILRFLDRRLKPGGAAMVSYNALPGWTGGQPVQFLLRSFAEEARGTSDVRILSAYSRIARMAETESPYLTENAVLGRIKESAERGEIAYLTHEYLTPHWAPQYHADVARDMSRAKLAYVGSTVIPCNFPELMMSESQRRMWGEIEDAALRESFVDFFNIRSFRSDLYLRGRRMLEPGERDARLKAVTLGPALPREKMGLQLEVPSGKVTLSEPIYAPMLDRLSQGPCSVGELMGEAEIPRGTELSPGEVAGLLVSLRAAMPVRAGVPVPGPVPLNDVLGRQVLSQSANRPTAVVLPRLGTALSCAGLEAATLALLCEQETTEPRALAEAVWAPIAARGETLMHEGQPVRDPEENTAMLTRQIGEILESRLGIWRMHGALPPSMA